MDKISHEEITKAIFGKSYSEIHEWIDNEYATHQGYSHWQYNHHLEAIEFKYGKGTIKYKVALLHIITDWIAHWGKVHIPKNREEVILFLAVEGVDSST